ncbi:MAG TPA: GvpL/GvpF family gas vesicle protein [Gaiellaceae bacterium]|nr:GvpL/GvpF family gas vesicle protein [Gaiellaceae bacterium]
MPATVTEARAYVYGITWADGARASDEGVLDAAVQVLEHGELAALVSELPSADIRARRRDLLRHADVLQQAFERRTILPLGFGTVFASSGDVVAELLETRYEELVALLQSLDGLVELTLRAFYDEAGVLAAIVRDEPRIAVLRGSRDPADQVALGEAVAHGLAERRARDADAIVSSLASLAREVEVEERVAEFEVVRAAFLVDRAAVEDIETRAEELAGHHDGLIRFKLIGPLPPHHFVSERWAS